VPFVPYEVLPFNQGTREEAAQNSRVAAQSLVLHNFDDLEQSNGS
jgi:hypothetical protein